MSSGIPEKIDPNQKSYMLYEGIEYKDFWRESNSRSRLDELEREIICELLPSSGNRIIDLGCGYGRLTNCYFDRFDQKILFDASVSLLQQAQETTGGKGWFIAGDINHLPFRKASFDNVLMVRVFHHLPDSEKCLSEITRILSQNGKFIFSYSNKRNLARIFAYLLGKDKNNPFSHETFGLESTLIRHHPAIVDNLLLDNELQDLQYRGVGVVDKLTHKQGLFKFWLTMGKRMAPALGATKLAPWVFCKSTTQSKIPLIETNNLVDLLECPFCGSDLIDRQNFYICTGCNKKYPIVNGIIDLRPG